MRNEIATGRVTLTKPSGRFEPERVGEVQRLGDEEVEIFEIGEDGEIERDAERRAPGGESGRFAATST